MLKVQGRLTQRRPLRQPLTQARSSSAPKGHRIFRRAGV
jgi:hypothetical protein